MKKERVMNRKEWYPNLAFTAEDLSRGRGKSGGGWGKIRDL